MSAAHATANLLNGYALLWVIDWGDIPSGTTKRFCFQSSIDDMIPWPSSGQYGYYGVAANTFKNQPTVAGQGSGPSDAPSQKVFSNHQFVKYNDKYYDPSYGKIYTGDADFQTQAIQGYGKYAGVVNQWNFTPVSSTVNIHITP